ncbi:MAG: MFS transporter [Anaerolineaceae bacterium]|jgi:PAT family beta-lactamase induction signal transducer AmpG|nr:MFS transporter [Anaerolineaceae bacterium]
MEQKRVVRYIMFGLLYFTQGTILSYFTALNALYLLQYGIDMTRIGIMGTIALIPFVIKVFLGMLSDKVNVLGLGHRKPYIVIGLVVQIMCLIFVPLINPGKDFWLYVAIAFLLQMGMALYDTCTDGLALDTTPVAEKGTIQGFMVGGRAVGVIVTASLVGLLAENVSWSAVFWVLAVLTLPPFFFLHTVKEAPRVQERAFDWKAFSAFKQLPVIGLSIIGFIFFMIIIGVNQIVNPYLQETFNISLSTAGFFTTVWGVGVVIGSITGGGLINKLGNRTAVLIGIGVALVAILALAAINQLSYAWFLVALFGICYGTYQTVYFAIAMEYTDPRIAATMFSILMAVTNIGQGVGLGLTGFFADSFGFKTTFIIMALLNFAVLPFLPMIFGKNAKKTVPAV